MEFLSKENESGLSIFKQKYTSDRESSVSFEQISNLQKVVVRQNLHQMVSPLNAIQGYLELLDASADVEPNAKQKYYKKQIETGLNELQNILKHIHSLYERQQSNPKKSEIESPEDAESANELTSSQLKPSTQLLDVDVNWVIRDGVKQVEGSDVFISYNLATTHTHIEADIFLLRVVFHELFTLCSSLYSLRGITSNISTYYEEDKVLVRCELSEPIGLGDWAVDTSLPLKQFHRWLDLAKSIGIQAASTHEQFAMSFSAVYGKQRVK